MAVLKNISHTIKSIRVGGKIKRISPNQIFRGPESLASTVDGIVIIKDETKSIIVNTSKSNNTQTVTEIPKKKENDNGFTKIINEKTLQLLENEYNYLEEYKEKNRLPTVSIIILTKNSLELIKNCCKSILKHVSYPFTQIVIADTGTTDRDVISYYDEVKNECYERDFGFQIVYMNYFNFSRNYNEVINKLKTDYVLIQNNDTVALCDYVTQMMKVAILNKVGTVGSRLIFPDGLIQHDGQMLFNENAGLLGALSHVNYKQNPNNIQNQYGTTLVHGNTGACLLVRRDDYLKTGGFNENYKDIFQDVEFAIQFPIETNRYNYCNRNTTLIHIDNASRLNTKQDPEKIKQTFMKMVEDTRYLRSTFISNSFYHKKPEKFKYSIVTIVNDIDEYRNFMESIKSQSTLPSIEFIAIPNFNNLYKNAFEALNIGLSVASGQYVITCHQDIEFEKQWFDKVNKHIFTLEKNNIKWGVIGPAGITIDSKPKYFITGVPEYPHEDINEVFCLDELCMIINKSANITFDEKNFSGYHFYGLDICTKANKNNYKVFSINAITTHKSGDGTKNLNTIEKYQDFIKLASKARLNMHLRKINRWRTTTTDCKDNNIIIYIPDPITKNPSILKFDN